MSRSFRRLTRRLACAMLTLLIALAPSFSCASSYTTSLTCAIVATDDLVLRPLELNQRDVVSVLDLVYESLFTLDDNYAPQPELAYSYDFVSGGQRLRVVLRDDVTFHSGKKLTSEDVIATLDYMRELSGFDAKLNSDVALEDRGLYYATFYTLKSWEAEDDRTLLFTLSRPSYGSLYAFTFPILPANEVRNAMPSGTGPYKYDGYEQGSAIWLTANMSWWQHPPQVRNIRANIYRDSELALNAFDTQAVDIAMSRSINASRYSGSLNSYSLSARTRQLEVLLLNRAQKLFQSDDKGENLVRRAVSYAINRSALISSVYQGMATVAYTPIPAGTWLSNESTIEDIYDPLMAAALLEQAGYQLANDGKRYRGGEVMPTLRMLVYDEPGSTVRTNAANLIKEQLEAVGFSIVVETWQRKNVIEKLRNLDYYFVLAAFNFDVSPDPGFTLSSTGSCNYTRYRSDTMNALLDKLRKTECISAEAYAETMREIQAQFIQDMPYLPLYWRSGTLLSRSAFTNARDIRELELLRGVEAFTY